MHSLRRRQNKLVGCLARFASLEGILGFEFYCTKFYKHQGPIFLACDIRTETKLGKQLHIDVARCR